MRAEKNRRTKLDLFFLIKETKTGFRMRLVRVQYKYDCIRNIEINSPLPYVWGEGNLLT